MATMEELAARRRPKLLDLHARDGLSDYELIGSLLDTFTEGREAEQLAADPDVREQIRAFFARFHPDPLPPAYVFGQAPPGYLERLYQERCRKYAALLRALGLDGGG